MSVLKSGMVFAALVMAALVGFVGCTGGEPANDSGSPESETGQVEIPEKMSGIAKLPESEQANALAQRSCPVTEKPLGSMGKPIKVSVEGREVFVCCEGCVDMVKENPDEYLAKLSAKE